MKMRSELRWETVRARENGNASEYFRHTLSQLTL